MHFGVSAKAVSIGFGVAVAGKACNAKPYKSRLPNEPAPYLIRGLSTSAAAAALHGWPRAPPKDGAVRLAATVLAGNAFHPKVHNTLYSNRNLPQP